MKSASGDLIISRLAVFASVAIALILAIRWKIDIGPYLEKSISSSETSEPLGIPVIERPDDGRMSRMNPVILQALGMRDNLPDDARIILLRQFKDALSEDEIRLLFHLLLKGSSAVERPGWYSEYMHGICCLLRENHVDRSLFASVLAALASDSHRDETVRDYALQHLRFVWEEADSRLRNRIVATMKALASEKSTVAPSALLSLHVLGSSANASRENSGSVQKTVNQTRFGLSDETIEPSVARILHTPPHPESTVARMTAVRIIRERKLTNYLSDLRRMAEDNSGEHTVVRMGCIAAIAELGTTADIAFLDKLDRRDPRIDSALRHSINKHP